MITKEEAKEKIKVLIEKYNSYKEDKDLMSNERQICDSLIRPLFRDVLGWNIEDPYEFKSEYGFGGKRVDYLVCVEGVSQFIVEAKAPSREIKDKTEFYKQTVQYAEAKGKDFAILTNFKQIIIFRAGINNLLKDGGYFGFITPDSYFVNQSFDKLRDFLIYKTKILNMVDFPYRFFPFKEVNTETAILILKKQIILKQEININKVIKGKVETLLLNEHNSKKINIPVINNSNKFFINMSQTTISILSNKSNNMSFNEFFVLSNPSSLDRKRRYPKTKIMKYDKCVFTLNDLKKDNELKNVK